MTRKEAIRTNGDFVRRMKNDELAAIIMCPYEFESGNLEKNCNRNRNCIECCLEWLESEAQDEEI